MVSCFQGAQKSNVNMKWVRNNFLANIFSRDALRDLVSIVQFKKLENHPWIRVTFVRLQTKTCNFTESSIPPRLFLNCTNGTILCMGSHIEKLELLDTKLNKIYLSCF